MTVTARASCGAWAPVGNECRRVEVVLGLCVHVPRGERGGKKLHSRRALILGTHVLILTIGERVVEVVDHLVVAGEERQKQRIYLRVGERCSSVGAARRRRDECAEGRTRRPAARGRRRCVTQNAVVLFQIPAVRPAERVRACDTRLQ